MHLYTGGTFLHRRQLGAHELQTGWVGQTAEWSLRLTKAIDSQCQHFCAIRPQQVCKLGGADK